VVTPNLDDGAIPSATPSACVSLRFVAPRQVDLAPARPEALSPGHVRVRTLYSGISAGTELTAYRGSNVYLHKRWDARQRLFLPGEHTVSYPIVGWGYSEVGEVVEVADHDPEVAGPTAARPRPGDVVAGIWGHRSEAVVAADDLAGRQLPAGVDPVLGVFARVGAIALNAVLAARVHLTETVVITGQGVIGLIATRLAVLSGARVIAVDPVEARRSVAERFGATHCLDPSASDVASRVRELTGTGADAAIELSGSYQGLHEAIRCAKPGGRVVAAGFYQGPASGLDLGEEFHHNRVTITSSQIGGLPTALADKWDTKRLHRAVMELISDRQLDVGALVTHVVPITAAADVFRMLDEDPADALQVVLDFQSSASASESRS